MLTAGGLAYDAELLKVLERAAGLKARGSLKSGGVRSIAHKKESM
jgi:hypothetical protein